MLALWDPVLCFWLFTFFETRALFESSAQKGLNYRNSVPFLGLDFALVVDKVFMLVITLTLCMFCLFVYVWALPTPCHTSLCHFCSHHPALSFRFIYFLTTHTKDFPDPPFQSIAICRMWLEAGLSADWLAVWAGWHHGMSCPQEWHELCRRPNGPAV